MLCGVSAFVRPARKFQLLPKGGKPPAAPKPTGQAPTEPTGQTSSPPKETNGNNGANGTNATNGNGHQPSGPEAPVQDQQFQVDPALRFPESVAKCSIQQTLKDNDVQDKAQYFPQDPTQQPFPALSTDPKVTASVQVPLKVEVERRKRLFANQDIMYVLPNNSKHCVCIYPV